MDAEDQDAVLYILYLLTRFPPAVRAMHVLTLGEIPQLSERAALSQCLYEVLHDVVPIAVIKYDRLRYLEGPRLLFGLVLEKAKCFKGPPAVSHDLLPYAGARVYDLRSAINMKPVRSVPVKSRFVLLDAGCYDASAQYGPLT